MKTPEARVKDEIKDWLKSIGAYYFMPVQMGYGATTLDILCCVDGRFVAIEVKAPEKKPTARQLQIIEQIKKAGGIATWANDAESVKSWIQVYL